MTHRRTNEILTVSVVIVALFILLAPVAPNIDYWWKGLRGTQLPDFARNAVNTGADDSNTGTPEKNVEVPKDNRIVIPKIGADAPIFQGATASILEKGPWLRPKTSAPNLGGNTVIAGHRFSYNPGVNQPFFHLDKLVKGDKIVIAWGGNVYTYTVQEKFVVKPSQVSIEAQTSETKLTLYTCTPLWNPIDRLVIVATPDRSTR